MKIENAPNADDESIVPFLKWAGGKRWLWRQVEALVDGVSFERYVEPFLGSGAIYFALQPHTALLNDANQELVACYRAIRAAPERVEMALECFAASHSDKFYYAVRDQIPTDRFERAARFLYLNRTCWNGLYRVNLRGEFNVPRGTKNRVLLPTDDFAEVACLLEGADLRHGDFELAITECGDGDLLFVDPPYTVTHNNNGFLKYNQHIFSWADQERLHRSLVAASERGASIILTNADHKDVRDLYSDFPVRLKVGRHSVIAGNSDARRATSELLITNIGAARI